MTPHTHNLQVILTKGYPSQVANYEDVIKVQRENLDKQIDILTAEMLDNAKEYRDISESAVCCYWNNLW